MASSQLQSSRAFVTQLFDALSVRAGYGRSAATGRDTSNPLDGAGSEVKKQLLALHVAFPNELLPALDLLDRTLVTRFRIRCAKEDRTDGAAPQAVCGENCNGNVEGAVGNHQTDQIHESLRQNPSRSTGAGATKPPDAEMHDAPWPVSAEQADDEVVAILHSTSKAALNTIYYVRSAQQRSSRFSTSYDTLTSYEVRLNAWNCSCPAFAFSAFPPVQPEPTVPTFDAQSEVRTKEAEWSFGGVSLGEGIPPVCKHLLACVLAERCPGLFGGCVEERVVSVEEAAGWAAGWGD